MFSFNNPFGACDLCGGLGEYTRIDEDLLIPDKNVSIRDGALRCYGWSKVDGGTMAEMFFDGIAKHYGFSIDVPVKKMKREDLEKILYGTDGERIKYSHSSTYSSGTFYGKFEGVSTMRQARRRRSVRLKPLWPLISVKNVTEDVSIP